MTTQTITATASGTWNLGDLTVNRIGFGTMRLPQYGAAFAPDAVPRDREQAIRVLRRAVELGVNHLDTAAFYFSSLRSANELINSALAPYSDDLVIVTKVGPARGRSGDWEAHARTPEELRGQVEENLRQLGRDHLDVVNLRILGTDSIAERFGALADLREAGLIRHLGLSNIRPHHLAEAQAIAPVVCVQNMYGLGAAPEQEEVLRLCGEQGIAFVPFYAIAGKGRETGAVASEEGGVQAVADRHGVSAAQVRLAWTLHRGQHVLAIPGTGDLDHLAQNVAAGALRLSEEDLAALSPSE
ncbi:aldo/keto reductase [Streptomyces sp. NRRL WC-3742]|uniref:aldo/keto reductase n=1 Tax=Streptomyces sp. NRRL WC-3742 TaxID=1463934 RepID=UPI0004CA8CC8|nr:aldo/keto reductase [Streptomyces sp. NRRL WC-3742]